MQRYFSHIAIYVTTHRCAGGLKKKLNLRSGSQRHRHFVGFFNVPVQTPTRGHPFYTVIPPHLVAFYDTLGIRRTHSRLNTPGPHGGGGGDNKEQLDISFCRTFLEIVHKLFISKFIGEIHDSRVFLKSWTEAILTT